MDPVTLSTGSITLAMKARELLLSVGISSRLRRLRPELTQGGCAWGLELDARELRCALEALGRAGIPASRV